MVGKACYPCMLEFREIRFMKSAYERKEEYGKDGKCLRREWSVGDIVPWAIVALIAILSGHALLNLPPSFWSLLRR